MDYYLPVRFFSGRGAVRTHADALAALGSRCLIVTGGSSARRSGALEDVTAALAACGTAFRIYDGIRPNPSIDSCIEAGRQAAAFGAEFLVGVGGGSPLDAAKAAAISAANPELDAPTLYAMRWPHAPLPVALVGTTAGTGSEVTPVAVITDTDGCKRSFRSEQLYAAVAFGDARYTASVPQDITASTGADALAHCLESWFSKTANDVSRAFAAQGAYMLLPPLRRVAEGMLPTAEERETLYRASILGGMAISVTGTVMPHKLGYYLTETHGVPHGTACAVFLPALLRHAAECAPELTQELLRRMDTDLEQLTALIRALTPKIGIRLSRAQIRALLPRWENAPAIGKTVGELTAAQLEQILCALFSE